MPNSFYLALTVLAIAAAQSSLMTPAANAAIVCKGGFQNSNGNWISTPYCNDAHLAQIARRHGAKVSDSELRNNPGKKDEICRFVDGMTDARSYCPDASGPDRSR